MLNTRERFRSNYALIIGILLLMALFVAAGKAAALSEGINFANGEPPTFISACPILVTAIHPKKDNTLYEPIINPPIKSNGAGNYIFAGNTDGFGARRALVSFDIAGNILKNSTIISTTLDLHMSKTIIGDQTVSLHKLFADWGEGTSDALGEEGMGAAATEGDATWQHTFYSSTTWSNEGGDFASTASVTQTVGFAGSYTWGTSSGMVEDVQGWLQDPGSNYGWIILGRENLIPTAKRFDSRENPIESNRPRLNVAYIPPTCIFLPAAVK
ncbi:MAG TPA: DNRLRE domain-containing protein [Patescibacteria group bacterium]|nr:DNRLRE domain-containing protein [Patescibacteria group bacterium]